MDERKRESAKKIEKRKKEIAEWEREKKKKKKLYKMLQYHPKSKTVL